VHGADAGKAPFPFHPAGPINIMIRAHEEILFNEPAKYL
jgi:hypothetical protein